MRKYKSRKNIGNEEDRISKSSLKLRGWIVPNI